MSEVENYHELNNELEDIILKLQSSDLDIDQIIKEYQRGIYIIDELEKYLSSAQNKIKKLSQKSVQPKK